MAVFQVKMQDQEIVVQAGVGQSCYSGTRCSRWLQSFAWYYSILVACALRCLWSSLIHVLYKLGQDWRGVSDQSSFFGSVIHSLHFRKGAWSMVLFDAESIGQAFGGHTAARMIFWSKSSCSGARGTLRVSRALCSGDMYCIRLGVAGICNRHKTRKRILRTRSKCECLLHLM